MVSGCCKKAETGPTQEQLDKKAEEERLERERQARIAKLRAENEKLKEDIVGLEEAIEEKKEAGWERMGSDEMKKSSPEKTLEPAKSAEEEPAGKGKKAKAKKKSEDKSKKPKSGKKGKGEAEKKTEKKEVVDEDSGTEEE